MLSYLRFVSAPRRRCHLRLACAVLGLCGVRARWQVLVARGGAWSSDRSCSWLRYRCNHTADRRGGETAGESPCDA